MGGLVWEIPDHGYAELKSNMARKLIFISIAMLALCWFFYRTKKPTKNYGYIVYKEYEEWHLCLSNPVFVSIHSHRYIKARYTIWVANKDKTVTLNIDSARYNSPSYGLGKKIFYNK